MRIRVVSLDEASERFQRDTDSEDRAYTDRRQGCLEKCLGELSHQERDLALEFYKHEKAEKIANKKRMAEAMGITTGSLRVRAYRVRKHLEDCVTKCLTIPIA
jgi:DNA-directed RNA polymerase specialized sigma24 family protein